MSELQAKHEEKKKTYDAAKHGHESKMSKLDNEVAGYKEEMATAESKYHQVNCQLKLVGINIKRVTQVQIEALVCLAKWLHKHWLQIWLQMLKWLVK